MRCPLVGAAHELLQRRPALVDAVGERIAVELVAHAPRIGIAGSLLLFRYGMPFRSESGGYDTVVAASTNKEEEENQKDDKPALAYSQQGPRPAAQ